MDRFIVREYSIHSIHLYNLKSNMDRFIDLDVDGTLKISHI